MRIVAGMFASGIIALASGQLRAAPVPLSAVPDSNGNGIIDLQDVIAAGAVTVGDKLFDNFSYTHTGALSPDASHIAVIPALGSDIGIEFTANWTASEGLNTDSVINYAVHVTDTSPLTSIDSVGLHFNGSAPEPGRATFASVTETVKDAAGHTLGQISTIDDGSGPRVDRDNAAFALSPTQRDLFLTKDIIATAAPTSLGGGTATISVVDNTFHQVPEPAALSLIGLGGLGLASRRRRA